MATTSSAKAQLAKQSGGTDVEKRNDSGGGTVADLIKKLQPQIARALPASMDPDRFSRIVLTTLRTNPKLMKCDPQSLMAACMLSAQLGLEPGPLGHAYFVPYGREVTFIVGYRGMLDLARRSGEIVSIEAREVRAADEFEFEFGLEPVLRHRPATGDRGEPTHYYGVAKFKDGGHYFEVLTKADVDSYRARSKASKNGPWVTDYSAMARKTVVRRMAPYLPLSAEMARAMSEDEGTVRGMTFGADEVEIDTSHDDVPDGDVVDAEVVDEETGEIVGRDDAPADGRAAMDRMQAALTTLKTSGPKGGEHGAYGGLYERMTDLVADPSSAGAWDDADSDDVYDLVADAERAVSEATS